MNKKTLFLALIFSLSPMISHALNTSSIMSDFRVQEIMASSAYHQTANGTYRTVELLNLIATDMKLDTSSIMSDFRVQEIMASSAPQQTANGTYRTVELLNLTVSDM